MHTHQQRSVTHLKTTHSFIIYKHRRTPPPLPSPPLPSHTYKYQKGILVTVSVCEDAFNFLNTNIHSVAHL